MSLPELWFFLITFFWVGYFVLEGFDFGVGMLLLVLGRNDAERGTMLEAIGPVWDGNEVWLLVAGGATFAAFPIWYATLFSAAYLWLVLLILVLILRVLSFEWRERSDDRRWQRTWIWANAAGSVAAPLLWGVALSTMLKGLPINGEQDFTGSPGDFLTGYSLLAGVALVALCALHGAVFLALRTSGELRARAARLAARLAPVAAVLAIAFVGWTTGLAAGLDDSGLLPAVIPAALAALAALAAVVLTRRRREGAAFAATAATMALLVLTLFIGLFPNVLVSDPTVANSLTVDNASSSDYTLKIMTVAAAIVTPVVLAYQAWTYWVFRARLTAAPVGEEPEGEPVVGAE